MSSQNLRDLLARARTPTATEARVELERWRADLRALGESIFQWVVAIDSTGWAHVTEEKLTEADAGTYTAAGIEIGWDGVPPGLCLRPYGLFIHRARLMDGSFSGAVAGVARLHYGTERRPVCRLRTGNTSRWAISTRARSELHELDQESFADAVLELVGPALPLR